MLRKLSVLTTLAFLLFATYVVYQPGLNGDFLLDDQASLSHLKIIDGEPTAENLYEYFAASRAGVLKRPVSIFSFFIDAQTWPADAYFFKHTNVVIHLINGGLLFILLYLLFTYKTANAYKSILVAFIATALWLLNPFLVSTTLYVVQRMAMLPATFTLLGLLVYLIIRKRYHLNPDTTKSVLLFLVMSAATLLAAFSKENGILFIFLLLLFEIMICQCWLHFKPLSSVAFKWVLLLPTALLLLVIVLMIPGAMDNYDYRSFTLFERVLSQFRAVSSYLYYLFLPDYFTAGVFTDGFQVSKNLFNPLSTLFAVIFVTGLLTLAWLYRKHWVWFSFAVFFFFISQLLESSVFPLELYFEHRTYLSSLFLFVPVALLLSFLVSKSKIYIVIIIALLAFWTMFTHFRVNIWGNQILLMQESMERFPASVRARTLNAIMYDKKGLKVDALKMIEAGFEHSDALELRINAVLLRCDMKILTDQHVGQLTADFKVTAFDKDDLNPMAALMNKMIQSGCEYQFSNQQIIDLLVAFEGNSVARSQAGKSWVDIYWAKFYLFRSGDADKAVEKYLLTYKNNPEISYLLDAVRDLIAQESNMAAEKMLQFAQDEYNQSFKFKFDWTHYDEQIAHLTKEINQ